MESSVLPNADVTAILSAKFICLKVDVDNPGQAEKMFSQVKGNTLPFYAYVSPDGKFISGTSGFRNLKTFMADLEGVMKSDALRVPADLEKKLSKMADQAAKDAEAGKIAPVLKAGKDADAIRGFSDSKDRIHELCTKTLQSGQDKVKEAADLCRDGKFDESGAILSSLVKDFKGSEVERSAQAGTKALDRFKTAVKESDGSAKVPANRKLYEQIAKDCKDAPPFVELAESRMKE